MSISSIMSSITRTQKDIASLQKKFADEQAKENKAISAINQINRSINKNTSLATLNSKQTQIERHQKDIVNINKKKADYTSKIASKNTELYKYQQQLSKAEEQNRKKQETERKKIEKEQLEFQKKLTEELKAQKRAIENTPKIIQKQDKNYPLDIPEHDVFISHASEDKENFVKPLADLLSKQGINVWYDEFSLTWGSSLSRSIDKGLANSRYGIVVLSKAFLSEKPWTDYELQGLISKEMSGDTPVILPIWHEVSKSDVIKYSPTLADKLALNSSTHTIEQIAEQLARLLSK